MQSTHSVDSNAQQGLKDTWKAQNYFLSCQYLPSKNIEVLLPTMQTISIAAHVSNVRSISDSIKAISLVPSESFSCKPGQYLTLINPDNISRNYSIANDLSLSGHIELHVKIYPNGLMSKWIAHFAKPGMLVHIQGPMGECFYFPNKLANKPIVLIGTGTGLAPLYGIINDALEHGHTGQIKLIHGVRHKKDLYYQDVLKKLSQSYENFEYDTFVGEYMDTELSEDSLRKGKEAGAFESFALQQLNIASDLQAYICGAPQLVYSLKKKLFISGLSYKSIYADPFIIHKPSV